MATGGLIEMLIFLLLVWQHLVKNPRYAGR
jgi:hypothetical protein